MITRNQGLEDPRTMKYWLVRTLREARERTSTSRQDIATLANVNQSTVARFETHERFPANFDDWVAAYGYALEVDDGRELWARALKAWKQHGGIPVLGPMSPAQRARLLAVEAALRRLPDAGESQAEPNATHRKREAG